MIKFDQKLIEKYNVNCPRYTSYPTALQFSDTFTNEDYYSVAKQSNKDLNPISLYIHLPFCNTICYFCACNKIITKNKEKGIPYLEALKKEISLKAKLFDKTKKVEQLHFGGGTPTFYSSEQLADIISTIRENFNLYSPSKDVSDETWDYSIEIDPRTVDPQYIDDLKKMGLNRISLGLQDFNEKVQQAVNRVHTEESIKIIIDSIRKNKFKSINFDLIYGLPFQTIESFKATINKTIELNPDKISLFNYAHMPHIFKPQRRISENDLPSPQEKLEILKLSIDKLTKAGYAFIGMDHFAKENDELAIAQKNGDLYRNFQGYSTHAFCNLIGLGVSAISSIGNSYSQNAYTVDEYTKFLEKDTLPTIKGVTVDKDDQIRRTIIMGLFCNFRISIKNIEKQFNINFMEYFSSELSLLKGMIVDELANISNTEIQVTTKGRFFIRNICATFDRYWQKLQKDKTITIHSKAI